MNKKSNRLLETFWLVAAFLSLGAAIHKSIFTGIRESSLFYLITIIAAAMYMMRRSLRKKNYSE